MAWKYNNTIIRAGRSWTDDSGVTHPTSWMKWSNDQKISSGLVWEDDPQPFDSRFYWSLDIPKDLEELKSEWRSRLNETARLKLELTDWYVVRKSEVGTEIPTEVTEYRTSVRQAHTTLVANIEAAVDLEAFISVATTMAEEWPADGSELV
jgi:hypothetical protein